MSSPWDLVRADQDFFPSIIFTPITLRRVRFPHPDQGQNRVKAEGGRAPGFLLQKRPHRPFKRDNLGPQGQGGCTLISPDSISTLKEP